MILTCNEFPDTLSINGRQINWADMKTLPSIGALTAIAQDDVKRLLASIYYKVNKCTGKSYTMITPEQIRKRMIALGYTNVVKTKNSNFTNAMLNQTVAMLTAGKPVFLSAIPGLCFTSAHSWVIDGTMYDTNNECLVHMFYHSKPREIIVNIDENSGPNERNLIIWAYRKKDSDAAIILQEGRPEE